MSAERTQHAYKGLHVMRAAPHFMTHRLYRSHCVHMSIPRLGRPLCLSPAEAISVYDALAIDMQPDCRDANLSVYMQM